MNSTRSASHRLDAFGVRLSLVMFHYSSLQPLVRPGYLKLTRFQCVGYPPYRVGLYQIPTAVAPIE